MRRNRQPAEPFVNVIAEAKSWAEPDVDAIFISIRNQHGWFRMQLPTGEAERLATDLAVALHARHVAA